MHSYASVETWCTEISSLEAAIEPWAQHRLEADVWLLRQALRIPPACCTTETPRVWLCTCNLSGMLVLLLPQLTRNQRATICIYNSSAMPVAVFVLLFAAEQSA